MYFNNKAIKRMAEDYIFDNHAVRSGMLPTYFSYEDMVACFMYAQKEGIRMAWDSVEGIELCPAFTQQKKRK